MNNVERYIAEGYQVGEMHCVCGYEVLVAAAPEEMTLWECGRCGRLWVLEPQLGARVVQILPRIGRLMGWVLRWYLRLRR